MKVMVAVFDRAVNAFRDPVAVPHTGLAMREFKSAVQKEGTELFAHASDFELWQLGHFVEEEGVFVPLKERLLRGEDVQSMGGQ